MFLHVKISSEMKKREREMDKVFQGQFSVSLKSQLQQYSARAALVPSWRTSKVSNRKIPSLTLQADKCLLKKGLDAKCFEGMHPAYFKTGYQGVAITTTKFQLKDSLNSPLPFPY